MTLRPRLTSWSTANTQRRNAEYAVRLAENLLFTCDNRICYDIYQRVRETKEKQSLKGKRNSLTVESRAWYNEQGEIGSSNPHCKGQMITPCRLSLTVGAIQLAHLWVLGCITPRPELKTGRNRQCFSSRRKTKTSRSCEVMSPASGRGDRRLRCEGWASGSGEADAGQQVHLAKVPWRRRLRPWSRDCREAKCRLMGRRTCDRVRSFKMKVRIFPLLALCLLSEDTLFQRSSSARNCSVQG